MQYPQGYMLIDKQFELPSIETLQIWSKSKSPVYVQGVSKKNGSVEVRINNILKIHSHLDKNSSCSDQVVVFVGKKVGYLMNIALGDHLKKIYWIDSSKSAESIGRVKNAIDTAISFHICLHEAYDAYSRVSQFITNHTGESPFKDDQLDRFFQSRMWGDRSTAEQHLKRIAKNETRAGILNRLDL